MAYGSGCAASMFGLEVLCAPISASDVLDSLKTRRQLATEDALIHINRFEMTHGRFGFEPAHGASQQNQAYYLHSVSELGIRNYRAHLTETLLKICAHKHMSIIELQSDAISDQMLNQLIPVLGNN